MATKKLNAKNLKDLLWETLQGVKTGNISIQQADSIATQGREIIRTVNTQLKISHQSKTDVSKDVKDFNNE